jgi:phage gpG-like protein
MGVHIDIDVDLGNVMEELTAMEARAENFIPVFERARFRLAAANAENFASGGMPVGGWAPRTRRYAWPILRRTGDLMGSLTTLRGAPNEIRPTSAQFGTNVDYAPFHQNGTRKMAKRQIVYEPDGFARAVGQDAADHIMGHRSLFR